MKKYTKPELKLTRLAEVDILDTSWTDNDNSEFGADYPWLKVNGGI